jgi:hypothetical protein
LRVHSFATPFFDLVDFVNDKISNKNKTGDQYPKINFIRFYFDGRSANDLTKLDDEESKLNTIYYVKGCSKYFL